MQSMACEQETYYTDLIAEVHIALKAKSQG